MPKNNTKPILALLLVGTLPFSGCTLKNGVWETKHDQSQIGIGVGLGNPADEVGVSGVPGASVPTSGAIVARIQNGLKNNAVPTSGNFKTALGKLSGNLPQNTNPNLATGYEQVPILALAACSDVPLSAYNITGTSIPAARAALIAAGVNIVDQHTGGLGSSGPLAPQVSAIFGKLVDANAQISGETVSMAFISVCLSASTFGTQMMGF